MKKFLLVSAAALMVVSASAQLKRSEMRLPQLPKAERVQLNRVSKEAKASKTAIAAPLQAPKKASFIEPFYFRPAGAYYSPMIAVGGVGGYSYSNTFCFFKPFAEYSFNTTVDGADENTYFTWDVFHGYTGEDVDYIDGRDIKVTYGLSTQDMPKFYAVDPYEGSIDDENAKWFEYQMTDHTMEGTSEAPVLKSQQPVEAWAIPVPDMITDEEGVEFLLSAKTTVGGGRNANLRYTYTAYYGATSYDGQSDNGWWFGKNGEHIDGMAQVFEKPEHPYQLNKVYMMLNDDLMCDAPVKLTCKVYRLDEVPAYNDTTAVGLPIDTGTLIVTGEGEVTPETGTANNGFVEFTLYGFDEDDPDLTYEYSPTVDYPIMVVVEGYNDPEAEDLIDFTCYISGDDDVDEGYGETAYLKYPRYIVRLDENGDTVKENGEPVYDFTGEYFWRGLNNFFRSGQMKTAFAIFIVAEQPFITFNYTIEDGQHTFPAEGGELNKEVEVDGQTAIMDGIYFYSWVPSADGDWTLTWNGVDELPDWLNIELEDIDGDEEHGWEVHAAVTADPLPEGVNYREATVRFEIPGDFIEYKFMQGVKGPDVEGDVNGDGDVSIADVNALIDIILGTEADEATMKRADVNKDGDITIADVNALIDMLLTM